MYGKSSNLGQFWQELKRRKVILVFIVHASASFVLPELVSISAEPVLTAMTQPGNGSISIEWEIGKISLNSNVFSQQLIYQILIL
jgi:hypothetical protein